MSWLTDTIGKVREQGNSLVTAAKQVKHRLTSEQGDAQLESQAREAVAAGPNAVEQLCQAWSRQLNTAANVSGGIAKDHFWQALLRSRAVPPPSYPPKYQVEILLEGQHAQHAQKAGPGQFDGTALRLLVSRVLPDDHAALGQELLTIITGERGDLASDEHTSYAARFISSSKVDSGSEVYTAESGELLQTRQRLLQDLQKLSSSTGESLDRPARLVQISSDLLGNYEASNQNLEEASQHCMATAEARKHKLMELLKEIEAYAASLEGSDGVGQKQHVLQDKLRECHDALSAELTKMDKQRESSDRQIESLENKKLILRQKLQTIDEKLHAAREVQRSCFEQRDACCKAVADVEGQFRSQLQKAEDEGLQATREHDAAKEVKSLAVEAETLSSQALKAAADELEMKAAQFDDHLVTVLMDHIGQEERRIHHLAQESEHCFQVVQKHKAEIQMLNVMDRPANTVLDSLEHKRLRQTATAAEVALKSCAGFVRDFGPFLDRNAEAQSRIRKLETDHAQVLRTLAPVREFLGCDPAAGTRASTPTPRRAQDGASSQVPVSPRTTPNQSPTSMQPTPQTSHSVAAQQPQGSQGLPQGYVQTSVPSQIPEVSSPGQPPLVDQNSVPQGQGPQRQPQETSLQQPSKTIQEPLQAAQT